MVKLNIEEFDYYTNLFEYAINKKLIEEVDSERLKLNAFSGSNAKLEQTQLKLEQLWLNLRGKEFIVRNTNFSYVLFFFIFLLYFTFDKFFYFQIRILKFLGKKFCFLS